MRDNPIPKFYTIDIPFERPKENDIAGAVARELPRLFPDSASLVGKTVAITGGSRGIANIDTITKSAVDWFTERGASPFILPAMGSHGGGTPEGQSALLDHYGISEATMGVPIKSEMETHSPGVVDGVEIHCAQVAWEADIILPLNRVKAHTGIKGPLESGISKICAIGLGKLRGAECYHSPEAGVRIGDAIRIGAQWLIDQGKVQGGLAIVENGYHETAIIQAVPKDTFFEDEEALLTRSKELLPRLALPSIDLLWLKQIGKDISGSGLDTNVVNRHPHAHMPGKRWQPEGPKVVYILVSELSPGSEGNGLGMGICDFATQSFAAQVDHQKTQLNALTSFAPNAAGLPLIRENDQDMLNASMSVLRRSERGPAIVGIKNTQHCSQAFVSEAGLATAQEHSGAQALEGPFDLDFTEAGDVIWPLSD